MKKCCGHKHPDHSGELKRLNRVAGQIEGVRAMIEEQRYCPEILTQLRAARAALRALETAILGTHLGACVTDTIKKGSKKGEGGKNS